LTERLLTPSDTRGYPPNDVIAVSCDRKMEMADVLRGYTTNSKTVSARQQFINL